MEDLIPSERLFPIAYQYSLAERISEMEAKQDEPNFFNSTRLDALIALDENTRVHRTACMLGLVQFTDYYNEMKLDDEGNAKLTDLLSVFTPGWIVVIQSIPTAKFSDFPKVFHDQIENLPDDQNSLFALWIKELDLGPLWNKLDTTDRIDIAYQLLQELITPIRRPNLFDFIDQHCDVNQNEAGLPGPVFRRINVDELPPEQQAEHVERQKAFEYELKKAWGNWPRQTYWEPSDELLARVGITLENHPFQRLRRQLQSIQEVDQQANTEENL